ncbi:MAG TPA: AAA family ATPase [Candidatus Limnocylindria bacterium]
MTDTSRVFVADPDGELLAKLRPALAAAGMTIVGRTGSVDAAMTEMVGHRPDVIVLDDAACAGTPVEAVRRIAGALPNACVIVTAASGTSPSIMGRAVAAGARGFLIKPFAPDELVSLIRDATSVARPAAAPTGRARGRIVSVYSPKGGAGATTVAVNLAVALATSGLYRVGIVDLDLQFGDVGVLLNLSGANSIAELLEQTTVSDEIVNDTFLRHASGLRVLLAPEDLAVVEAIEPGQVTHALEQLRAHFDILVCDLWSMYEHLTRDVLRMSDHIVFVTTPDLPSLKDLRRVLAAGADTRHDDRSVIVMNRGAGKAGFSPADVAKVLERPVSFTIPSDGIAITDAVNRGLSVLDPRIRSKAEKSFRELAAYVAGPRDRAQAATPLTAAKVRS